MELLGYFGATLIGVSLGFLGGGGSILAVPLLVYIFKLPAATATLYSLFIVGLTSLVGFVRAARLKQVSFSAMMSFAIPSLAGVLLVRRVLLPLMPGFLDFGFMTLSKDTLIMTAFALVMLLASIAMIRPGKKDVEQKLQDPWWLSAVKALGVGAVTGFVGAGGGFLIVPALVVMSRLPMKIAVGTSLGVIAFNSLFGFLSDAISGVAMDFVFVLKISILAIAGIIVGLKWGQNTSDVKLKPLFGYFVLIVGALIFMSQFSY
ncbi:sulfite exporter TauE/SafE family protein [Bdellovibrio sp. ZAP7]|uniref:sulfite exporter TauE/SafE family protein n=1 Tax=Bdellovibrio sp. ZAP7 TaxID=2231053 RepID=UPI00115ABE54|nr:sulfite exporter TauE/SafE family protein [Bdellovibrio sp. ZAP7]QDK44903.1 sulfite exporter TauE/SafE family protein [Bdellovibrio sp. ZAP7]